MPDGTERSRQSGAARPEDPDTVLAEFAEEMRRELTAAKERAVEALHERNRL